MGRGHGLCSQGTQETDRLAGPKRFAMGNWPADRVRRTQAGGRRARQIGHMGNGQGMIEFYWELCKAREWPHKGKRRKLWRVVGGARRNRGWAPIEQPGGPAGRLQEHLGKSASAARLTAAASTDERDENEEERCKLNNGSLKGLGGEGGSVIEQRNPRWRGVLFNGWRIASRAGVGGSRAACRALQGSWRRCS